MTNSNLTEIVLVVDRSGSMISIKDDAQGGINTFIKEQQETPGEATLTLCQFDTEYEFVCKGTPIKEVKPYTLVPKGSTALYDAIGRSINETGQRIAALPENDRPGSVICMVVTDGQENSSREFSGSKIREMIDHQKNKYNWKFIFLGTEENSIDTSVKLGFDAGVIYAVDKTFANYTKMSEKISSYRVDTSSGVSPSEAYARNMIYSEQDKIDLK